MKLNNDAALQVVEMFVNTRGVGLAEAFAKTCEEIHGLPPDRRYFVICCVLCYSFFCVCFCVFSVSFCVLVVFFVFFVVFFLWYI